ncbi:Flp pilus assembly protein TadG [Hamadaea flava]|uniref:Pilus assembly protein TadG-related protein n=1 Tax=Hamadaea flava TaxID=1742688 RepID=A0ABV8LEI6_9ACTN|nr:pilus assembly protein TadG-related protein [Hamadaea flava]MCP2326016.1 Flp pilus assembly protein TadG [Hamadaea flava]
MPRLTSVRTRLRRRLRRDEGGVAVLVALLTATGVLLAGAALAVDVGQLYAEREELQSGADAVALAVAIDCAARRPTECTDPSAAETKYANGNAKDRLTDVQEICGSTDVRTGRSLLPRCRGGYPDNLTACQGRSLPPNTLGYAEVHTRTLTNDSDRYVLSPTFARAVAGSSAGTTVGACSRVAWGAPMTGLAMTVCERRYNQATSSSTRYGQAPPTLPSTSFEAKFSFNTSGSGGGSGSGTPSCYTGRGDWWDADGEASWLRPSAATGCQSSVSSVRTLRNTTPGGCASVLSYAVANRIPVAVGIYDGQRVGRSGGRYVLKGVAAFVITGYNIKNVGSAPSWLTGTQCLGTDWCVLGYFTRGVTPMSAWNGQFNSATGLGAVMVKTVG